MPESHGSPRIPYEKEARFVMAAAINAAVAWGHPAVGPAHLVAGFLEHAPDLIPELPGPGAKDRIRAAIEREGVEAGEAPKPIAYDPAAKAVLAACRLAAHSSGRGSVTLADLLQGLRSRGDDATAALIGREAGDAVRSSRRFENEEMAWLRVSDESDHPYHQQIADQIRDAIAAGRLLPGERLPTVRRFAQILDLAPGTVAKAYRNLDTEGVIETAGTRGTLVARPATRAGDPQARRSALVGLLRPAAVAAFHMGASWDEFSDAVGRAAAGVLKPHEPR